MFEWNWDVKEMKLKKEFESFGKSIGHNREYVFGIENEMREYEKLMAVDNATNGALSRVIKLIHRFEDDLEDGKIKTNQHGHPKTVSISTWLRRNDTFGYITKTYNSKNFEISCHKYIPTRFLTSDPINHGGRYDRFDNLIDESFHRMLHDLLKCENKYFKNNDPFQIKKNRLNDLIEEYGWAFLGNETMISSSNFIEFFRGNKKKVATEKEIDFLIGKYEKLEKVIKQINSESWVDFDGIHYREEN